MSERNGRSTRYTARALVVAAGLLAPFLPAVPAAGSSATVTVSGCPEPGVEAGCIILKAGGEVYDVTAARPRPHFGVAGTVTGTVSHKVSMCMQGVVLSPATWHPMPGVSCRLPQP